MKKIIKSDIFVRALKTFIQCFLGSLVISLQGQQTIDEKLIKSALIGAVSSGFCGLMNLIINYINNKTI